MDAQPLRGQIWLADLNPTQGHEQAGKRPVLIVSNDIFNRGPAGVVFVLPLTRTDRRIPAHIPIEPPEGGVQMRSYVLCDAIRSITKDRLTSPAWGKVSPATMERVSEMLRVLMDL